MSSSGGGGSTSVLPTYTDPVNGMTFTDFTGGTDALNAEIAQRTATDLATSNTNQANATAQNTANEATFQQQLTNASTNATTQANQYFTEQGYDPSLFSSQLSNAILAATQSVSDPYANYNPTGTSNSSATSGSAAASANPSAAFSPNLGANIVQQVTSGYQNQASDAIDGLFSPTYAADNISNSWLAPATTAAVSSQFDPLTAELTNALKRGTLNQQGYDAANTALSTAQNAATSTVNNLGQNILANDQTGLNNYITGAKNDAANVNISDYGSFNPSTYQTGASNLVSQDQSNFSGDLTNAIGSTSFADLPTLLNIGGSVQGATDPTATNPAGAPGAAAGAGASGSVSDAYLAQQALASQQRGLGSTGAF